MRYSIIIALTVLASIFLAGCATSDEGQDTAQKEQHKQGQNYGSLADVQPARGMEWSPTRDNLNKWADTWDEQGKLSYVYVVDSVGHQLGYFIFEGLPVSYCASLTPPDKVVDVDSIVGTSSVDAAVVGAPAMDGAFYSGGNCSQMFGYDAVSGAYYEFTGGGSFNYFLSDQPMESISTKPLGDATPEKVKDK